jgi:hypothetical protein
MLAVPSTQTVLVFRATGSPERPDPRMAALLADVFGADGAADHGLRARFAPRTVMRSPHVFAKSKENFASASATQVYRVRRAAPASVAAVRGRRVLALLSQLFPDLRWQLGLRSAA